MIFDGYLMAASFAYVHLRIFAYPHTRMLDIQISISDVVSCLKQGVFWGES